MYRARTRAASAAIHCAHETECRQATDLAKCKLGYLIPSSGAPPIGCYSMVYPLNPNAGDARDGQVYSAQGYGGPVTVPIAPVVHHQYNYGWGVPSSRITHLSNPLQPQQ